MVQKKPLSVEITQWTDAADRVETLSLRDGVTLVLSDIALGEECEFHHVEAEDVFAIGFHLKGGSRFDMEGRRFDTRPLEVHAGAAPRTATSSFVLPRHGFRTMSLRFSPDAAQDLLARHGLQRSGLAAMVAHAGQAVSATRLAPLDPAGVAMIEAMFAAPYSGAGRSSSWNPARWGCWRRKSRRSRQGIAAGANCWSVG